MPTSWTPEERYAGSPSLSYDEPTLIYNQIDYSYNGQALTVWTNETIS